MTQEQNTAPDRGSSAGKRKILFAVLSAIALAVGLYWLFAPKSESTDNAQVKGHIHPLAPRIAGHIALVLFDENQAVKAGQTLIVLDSNDQVLHVRMAEAAKASAAAQVTAAEQELKNAQEQLIAGDASTHSSDSRVVGMEAMVHKLELDLGRAKELHKSDVIPRSDLDAAQAAYDSQNAQLNAARADAQGSTAQRGVTAGKVEGARAQLEVLKATLTAREADLDNARLQLGYCAIKAPADGVTGRRNAEVGQQVSPGQPLGAVVDTKDIWISANFKETQLADIRTGQKVKIKVDAYPGTRFEGTVESIADATGAQFTLLPPDNATGNFVKVTQRVPVRIKLIEPPADHPLSIGMNVTVNVSTGS